MRRRLSKKRVKAIAAGWSAVHDVETVPLAEEVQSSRIEIAELRAARDEACDIAESEHGGGKLGDERSVLKRIAELRQVGKPEGK